MPYIEKQFRDKIDPLLDPLLKFMKDMPISGRDGDLAYIFYKLLDNSYQGSFSSYNSGMGVLSSVGQEFYRRKIAPYENSKIESNGDV
jgi:hypothetical protein